MSNTAKWILAIVVVILIIAGVWYWGGKSTAAPAETGPIKIGGIIMQTGSAAEYGASQIKAIELAKEEINKNGGILGRQVEFVLEDTKCDPKEGATAVNKLINIDKVDFIISFECSGPSISGSTVAQQNKKVFIIDASSAPGIAKNGGEYVWRIAPADDAQGRDLANVVVDKGNKNVAILYINNDYGAGIEKVFEENILSKGVKLVAKESFVESDSDFKTQLAKIKSAKPDALVLVALSNQYPLIIKQVKSLNLAAKLFGSETMKDEKLIKELGSLAEGIIFTSYSPSDSAERQAFIDKIKNKTGNEPGIFADFAYDAIYVAKQAIEKAGRADSESLKKSLGSVSYQGATGLTEFDQYREVKNKQFSVYTVKGGQIIPIN